MVSAALVAQALPEVRVKELPKDAVKWRAVSLSDVLNTGKRLEASVFAIEGRLAREAVMACEYGISDLHALIQHAYYPGRFKRIYCDATQGVPFYLPSQMTDICPKPEKYISALTKCDVAELRLTRGNILLTRSGTIGNITLVSNTLDGKVFSDDVIRITLRNNVDIGFLYTYFRSKIGNTILQTNRYGSVIQHIEPEHLSDIPVPNATNSIKEKINALIMRSYDLRDKSNELIDKATDTLIYELRLPNIHEFKTERFDHDHGVDNYSVKLSNLSGRLDGSYHVPIVKAVTGHLRKHAAEVLTVGDSRVSKEILLPGRFKRVYVEEGQGRVFFSGKNIMELDPSDKKYLSFARHENRIRDQLTIRQNMILVTCSGTVGKVVLVPKHWDNWAMTHDIIRVIPNNSITGYLFIWLQSVYARRLIEAMAYGSVVPHIEKLHISEIAVPALANKAVQDKINSLALEANTLRYEAYALEQQALCILNDEVIFA